MKIEKSYLYDCVREKNDTLGDQTEDILVVLSHQLEPFVKDEKSK